MRLTTTTATTYYPVYGTTTSKIFEEMRARGLVEQDGNPALGLAAAKSELKWKALWGSERVFCIPESVTLTLDVVVTLPRHERPAELSNDLRERWQRFAADVAAHEQRHADIFLNGATAAKARIEVAVAESPPCIDLEATVRRLWGDHFAETEKAQSEFDSEDRARIANKRKPLQAEIDTRKARVAALIGEVRQLDASLDDLSHRADAVRQKIDAVNADIAKSKGSCSRPTDRIRALCRQYETLASSHKGLVAEHSSLVAHRNRLADDHNALVETSRNSLRRSIGFIEGQPRRTR